MIEVHAVLTALYATVNAFASLARKRSGGPGPTPTSTLARSLLSPSSPAGLALQACGTSTATPELTNEVTSSPCPTARSSTALCVTNSLYSRKWLCI